MRLSDFATQGIGLISDITRLILHMAVKGEVHEEQKRELVAKINWLLAEAKRLEVGSSK